MQTAILIPDQQANTEEACGSAKLSRAPVLSIVMPVYNEKALLTAVISRIRAISISHELIIVDDGSADGGSDLLDRLATAANIQLLRHAENRGKGAALRTGFAVAKGEIVIVQDADLEYHPADFERMIEPIQSGRADIVYGSRFLTREIQISRLTRCANWFITWLYSRFSRRALTDVETCYKAMRREVLQQVLSTLQENRFGIEIELAARLDRLPNIRIAEVPIHYQARTREQGKKIRFRDGVRALWCIFKYR